MFKRSQIVHASSLSSMLLSPHATVPLLLSECSYSDSASCENQKQLRLYPGISDAEVMLLYGAVLYYPLRKYLPPVTWGN
jgi:hypothetical protein